MSWKWKAGVLAVLIVGFSVLLFMGYGATTQAPPIPDKCVSRDGKTVFTGQDIMAGQSVFQKYGLMDVGSLFGHGAYTGPDFTADYLHRQAVISLDEMSEEKFGKPFLKKQSILSLLLLSCSFFSRQHSEWFALTIWSRPPASTG